MSPRKHVTLLAGGALHAMLVFASVLGILQTGGTLYAARASQLDGSDGPGPISSEGLSLAALLIVAVPFGWYCMKLTAVTSPWQAELRALTVIIPVAAVITVAGGLMAYAVRTDLAATYVWRMSIGVAVVVVGITSFYLIGKRNSAPTTSGAVRDVVVPQ